MPQLTKQQLAALAQNMPGASDSDIVATAKKAESAEPSFWDNLKSGISDLASGVVNQPLATATGFLQGSGLDKLMALGVNPSPDTLKDVANSQAPAPRVVKRLGQNAVGLAQTLVTPPTQQAASLAERVAGNVAAGQTPSVSDAVQAATGINPSSDYPEMAADALTAGLIGKGLSGGPKVASALEPHPLNPSYAKVPFPVIDSATETALPAQTDFSQPSLQRVPLSNLVATQSTVNPDVVAQKVAAGPQNVTELPASYKQGRPGPDDIPTVYQGQDGKMYLAGGTHRAVAALQRGEPDIQAVVYPPKALRQGVQSASEGAVVQGTQPVPGHADASTIDRKTLVAGDNGQNSTASSQPAYSLDQAASTVQDLTSKNSGASFNLYKGDLTGTPHYAVGMFPDRGQIIPGQASPEDISKFIQSNQDLLQNPENSIGTWFNKTDGKTYLDVSKTTPDLNNALALGKAQGQQAIYALKNLQEIPVEPKLPAEFTPVGQEPAYQPPAFKDPMQGIQDTIAQQGGRNLDRVAREQAAKGLVVNVLRSGGPESAAMAQRLRQAGMSVQDINALRKTAQ